MVTNGHTSFTYYKVCAHERSLKGLRFWFSNYAFDVHTVYPRGLTDSYHYFQTTHLTYSKCIQEDWMMVIVIFKLRIWRTHSLSMTTEWPLSLFSSYAFDVHTVYQWGLNDFYRYFQTTHLTYTRCINEDWMTVVVIIFELHIWRAHSYQWGLNRLGVKKNLISLCVKNLQLNTYFKLSLYSLKRNRYHFLQCPSVWWWGVRTNNYSFDNDRSLTLTIIMKKYLSRLTLSSCYCYLMIIRVWSVLKVMEQQV